MPQQEIQNFIWNYENSESNLKKNMSNSLKTIFLFIGFQLTVKEVSHQRNFYMKNDLSLGDLKKQKKRKLL